MSRSNHGARPTHAAPATARCRAAPRRGSALRPPRLGRARLVV
jgi:hypothetical protein